MDAEEPQNPGPQDEEGCRVPQRGGGNIHHYACRIVYKLNHGGRGEGWGRRGATINMVYCQPTVIPIKPHCNSSETARNLRASGVVGCVTVGCFGFAVQVSSLA